MVTALATALSQAGLQTSNFNSTDRPRCDKEKSSNSKGKVSFISAEEARQYNDYHQKKFNHSFQEPYQCPHFSGLNAHWHLRTVSETDPLAHTPTGFAKTNFDLSKGTANKSEKVLALLKDSTTRTYQE